MAQASGVKPAVASPPSSYVENPGYTDTGGRDDNAAPNQVPADDLPTRKGPAHPNRWVGARGVRGRVRAPRRTATRLGAMHFESVTPAFMLSLSLRKCGGINV
ncbi:hypothetical protein [Arthrobacter sp. GN70]|uniref:hypothetical protein n=1 Tax=Arthrobacter sp. GN70 TaxID=2838876 RepID=UPI001BFD3F38|nr:hypothetical protein [Arthrobacter sp. GN70]